MTDHRGKPHRPSAPCHVELVAYERQEGGYDLFAFEPEGVLPTDWEAHRIDREHVFLLRLDTLAELEQAAAAVNRKLGPDYEKVVGFRESEPGERRHAQRLMHRLHREGVTGYALKEGAGGRWELWLRRRDLAKIA